MTEILKYEICKCGFNPALNDDKFDLLFSEYAWGEKIYREVGQATCKTCGDKFSFSKEFKKGAHYAWENIE